MRGGVDVGVRGAGSGKGGVCPFEMEFALGAELVKTTGAGGGGTNLPEMCAGQMFRLP